MDFYDNAVDVHEAADILYNNGKYRMAVFNACLAIELYLKSRLPLVEYDIRLESSHDVINIYRCLTARFRSLKDLTPMINMCRKYYNEARYPYEGRDVFTIEFAAEFMGYLADVKDYIENECVATLSDLKSKYGKS